MPDLPVPPVLGVLPAAIPAPTLSHVRRLAIRAGIRAVATRGTGLVTVTLGVPGLDAAGRGDLAHLPHLRRRPFTDPARTILYFPTGDGVPGSTLAADVAVLAQLVNDYPACLQHWPIDLDSCVACAAPASCLDDGLVSWCDGCWHARRRTVA